MTLVAERADGRPRAAHRRIAVRFAERNAFHLLGAAALCGAVEYASGLTAVAVAIQRCAKGALKVELQYSSFAAEETHKRSAKSGAVSRLSAALAEHFGSVVLNASAGLLLQFYVQRDAGGLFAACANAGLLVLAAAAIPLRGFAVGVSLALKEDAVLVDPTRADAQQADALVSLGIGPDGAGFFSLFVEKRLAPKQLAALQRAAAPVAAQVAPTLRRALARHAAARGALQRAVAQHCAAAAAEIVI